MHPQLLRIRRDLEAARDLYEALLNNETLIHELAVVTEVVIQTLVSGGKILLAGNGGSAADAQHMAAEYVGRFAYDRKALPAIALTTDSSILTAVSNDYGLLRGIWRSIVDLDSWSRTSRQSFR